MDLSTKAGFQLFYKVQMFSFWSSLGHFLNKQILLLEVSPALYTNRLGLFIFTLWSETTHLVAIYNIYIASDTTGSLRAETKVQATQRILQDLLSSANETWYYTTEDDTRSVFISWVMLISTLQTTLREDFIFNTLQNCVMSMKIGLFKSLAKL